MRKKLMAAVLTIMAVAALAGCQGKENRAVTSVTGAVSASETVSESGRPDSHS